MGHTTSMTRAALFDVDGTLVDSTYLHAVAWWQAFRRAGLDVATWRLHRCTLVGVVVRRAGVDPARFAGSMLSTPA